MLLLLLLLLLPGLHSIAPNVSSIPPNFSISADQSLTLSCSHNQSDSVFWTDSSGAYIPSQTSDQLAASYVIQSADRSLNGSTFLCVANVTNSTQESTEVTIQVLFIDNSTLSVYQSAVRLGETLFLSCSPDAWPPASLQWSHSGASLGSANQLSVPVTSSAVAGVYTCVATNSEGSVTSSANVSVITDQSDFLLYRNDSSAVAMACNGTDLSWRMYDTFLTPSSLPAGLSLDVTDYKSTLLISDLDTSLAANYSCYLNSSNVVNSNFQILIPSLGDQFVTSPTSRDVFPTETLSVPCSPPPGDPEPVLSWYKSGLSDPLINSSVSGLSLLPDGSLSFSSFSQSDAGTYSCVAHNLAGFQIQSANLSILPAPTAVILFNGSLAVSPILFNDVTTLLCNVSTNGAYQLMGQLLFSWIESGQLIGQNQQLAVTISGEYRCEVEFATKDGSVTVQSDSVLLRRNNTLVFTRQIADQLIAAGGSVTVTCDTTGGTTPEFFWFFGNEEIQNSTNQIVQNNQLTLLDVSRDLAGEYFCYVTDAPDSEAIRQSFHVSVRYGPIVGVPHRTVTLLEGTDGVLVCHVDGSPPPEVTWSRVNGSEVTNFTFANGTLLLLDVTLSSAGVYVCVGTDPDNSSNFGLAAVEVRVLSSVPLLPDPSTPTPLQIYAPIGAALLASILLAGCVVCVALLSKRSCSRNRNLYLRDLEAQDSPNRPRAKTSPKYQPLTSQQVAEPPKELKFPLIGFPRDELSFGTKLGDGAYGPIIEGTIEQFLGERRHVAVECYISKSNEGAFPKPDELHTWPVFFLHHDNLSRVLGICTSVEPYYVVYEYSDRGCLKEYLRQYREQRGTPSPSHTPARDPSPLLTQALLLRMCKQAALGLEFLAQNDMVFRDVASRNCCVSSSLDIKLINLPIGPNLFPGDYFKRDKEFVPVRWMSPESLQNSQFTTKSDVWAFGVFCWEIFTYCRQPYEVLSDDLVLDRVPHGLRLEEPEEGCPEGAFRLMAQCWNQNPDKRPSFSTICVDLNDVCCD